MNIIVTGANGLLGQHLVTALVKFGYGMLALGKGECRIKEFTGKYLDLDITDGVAVRDVVVSHKPDLIIHAAAMTNVDQCEKDKQECYNVNVTATRFLVDAAKEVQSKIIYLSTDFVFDGMNGPYKEEDIMAPVNYYGSTKVAAEKAIMESELRWAIVRTVLVYGQTVEGTRTNIINWVKSSLEQGKHIKVVSDQYRTPTFVDDLVIGIMLLIEKNIDGIFHISGKEEMTPYDMAIETAKFLKLDESLIEKVDSSSFSQAGLRPAKTGFKIDKARNELGYEPRGFRETLEIMFGEEEGSKV
ncbi:MAG: SDR family oxidoreductase [Flavitalea sp.]